MIGIKNAAQVMNNTTAYRLWQAPFLHAKFAPILRNNDLGTVRRVLDVGCGPGTNCPYFDHTDYLGLDINPRYIEFARQRYGRRFEVADATQYVVSEEEKVDFVLLNSMLHHIDDQNTARILDHLTTVLSHDGFVHIIDLVLPERPSIPRFLAVNDRGDFSRPIERWQEIFCASLEPVLIEPFPIKLMGITLWNLVYVKGRAKR